MPIRIVTDSTADLTLDIATALGITVVPVYVRFGNEVYRDGVDISHDEIYRRLQTDRLHPTTSQPSPGDFARVYRQLAREADTIVSVHVTSKLSGTYQSALQGKELARVRARIEVIDSASVTLGLGLMAQAAARLAAAGASLSHILGELQDAIENTRLLGLFDTLRYLVRGGRIGKARALVGSVLNVRPLITMRNGELVPAGLVRTRARGLDRLVSFVRSTLHIRDLAVVYSTTPDEADTLRSRLGAFFRNQELIQIARLGPALGVHGGPGTLAVALRRGTAPAGQPATG